MASIIKHYYIFDIQSSTNTIKKNDLSGASASELKDFVIKLANNAKYGHSSRAATLNNLSPVKVAIVKYLADRTDDSPKEIANHLLDCEVNYNLNKGNFNEIRKGSMLFCEFEEDNQLSILIAKIDIENFFEVNTLKLTSGLPEDKGIFKTCLINLSNNNIDNEIFLADTNASIANFWWNNFLNSSFVRDSTENTANSYAKLNSILTRVKKVSAVDHTILKSNLASYYTTATDFNVTDMVDRVIGNYSPISDKVDTDKIKTDLKNACKAKNFDTSFKIDVTSIKTKLKQTFNIDDDIVVNVKSGDVSKLFHLEVGSQNYVAIKASSGYGDFPKLKT